jgi:acyl carrier protein
MNTDEFLERFLIFLNERLPELRGRRHITMPSSLEGGPAKAGSPSSIVTSNAAPMEWRRPVDAGPTDPITADSLLFENGALDSLSVLHLLAFIEHLTGRPVPDEMIVPENFRSARRIAEAFGRIHQ